MALYFIGPNPSISNLTVSTWSVCESKKSTWTKSMFSCLSFGPRIPHKIGQNAFLKAKGKFYLKPMNMQKNGIDVHS